MPDKRWDADGLRRSFKGVAEDAERYVGQIKARSKNPGAGDEMLLAEHEAKFRVYDHLSVNRALISREEFLAELAKMRAESAAPPRRGVNSAEFQKWYEYFIKDLIEQHRLHRG